MRQFLRDIRFAIKDAWQSRGGRKIPVDHSLARTIKESSHATRGGAMGPSGRTDPSRIARDGADDYVKSFDERAY